jgi:predicted nucleic acid-binding protein
VLNEAASVCRRKLKLPWSEVHELLDAVKACCEVVTLSLATHESALQLAERYQLPLYDALICASAQAVGAEVLYTEDLHDGLKLGHLQVRNPFK